MKLVGLAETCRAADTIVNWLCDTCQGGPKSQGKVQPHHANVNPSERTLGPLELSASFQAHALPPSGKIVRD